MRLNLRVIDIFTMVFVGLGVDNRLGDAVGCVVIGASKKRQKSENNCKMRDQPRDGVQWEGKILSLTMHRKERKFVYN